MHVLFLVAALLVTAARVEVAEAQCVDRPARTAEYRNGLWFDGSTFRATTMYADRGLFSLTRPAAVDTVIDLGGGYAIPPLGEAHNHNFGHSTDAPEETIATYIRGGVFYVAILSSFPKFTDPVAPKLNCNTSVDVIFAHGGVTGTRGHPVRLRETLLGYGLYPGFTKETLENHAYFIVDSLADIDRKLPLLLAQKPDVVKILLLYSEEYEKRKGDDEYYGRKGLNPELVPTIVERAHRAGKRVFAHVQTAHDFKVVVEAGVDVVAHLPGYRGRLEPLDSITAALAARKGIAITPTASLAVRGTNGDSVKLDSAAYRITREGQIRNLRLLRSAGVNVIVGSDVYNDTSAGEVDYLRELGIYSNAELLKMWAVQTPRVIFPGRRIGALENGYDASFLVLDGNPLEDWGAMRRIKLRVKQGRILH
jgi:phosphoribosylcarboxyaminoimidazole (NCAIR) mutase